MTDFSSITAPTGVSGNLASEGISTDAHGNETVSTTWINRATKTATQITDLPATTVDRVSITVNGQLQSTTSTAAGDLTTFGYDAIDRRTKVYDPRTKGTGTLRYSETHYNAKGQVDWTEDAADKRSSYTYYADTGLTHTESRMADVDGSETTVTTTYTYDDHGRVETITGAQYPVEYGYDVYGQMKTLKTWRDASNTATTTWNYDGATGLLSNKRYDDDKGPTYTYHPDGKLKTREWARKTGTGENDPKVKATYVYHPTGELNTTTYNDGTPMVTYASINRRGQPESITDTQGTRTLGYVSTDGALDTETIGGKTIDRTFEDTLEGAIGRPKGFVTSGISPSQTIAYGYDTTTGHFKSVASTVGTKSDTFTYSRKNHSDLLAGYSSAGATPDVDVSYAYEVHRNLKTGVVNEGSGNSISEYVYVYDASGQRTSRTDTLDGAISGTLNKFKYNVRGEVIGADMDGDNSGYEYDYNYDDIGNRASALTPSEDLTYTATALNQYTTILDEVPDPDTSTTCTFDGDGNLKSDGTWNYTWNAENRLVEMRTYRYPDTPLANDKKLLFKYDYMGRRFEKKVFNHDGSDWQPSFTAEFVYDGWNLVHEDYGTSFRSHVWGLDLSQTPQGAGGVGGLLSTIITGTGSTSGTYYPLADANGNITEYVNESGAVDARYAYDAFGVSTETGALLGYFPFRFSSKFQDIETDLNYYGYRYYAAGLGRWLNRDPIDERGGINLYGFVYNNPYSWVDDLGKAPIFGAPGDPTGSRTSTNGSDVAKKRKERRRRRIEAGKRLCDSYPFAGQCNRNGTMEDDTYTENAIRLCKDFMEMYSGGMQVRSVGNCLIKEEAKCIKKECCADRNACRFEAHSKCYTKNVFGEPFLAIFGIGPGFPEGGPQFGWENLVPDWRDVNYGDCKSCGGNHLDYEPGEMDIFDPVGP